MNPLHNPVSFHSNTHLDDYLSSCDPSLLHRGYSRLSSDGLLPHPAAINHHARESHIPYTLSHLDSTTRLEHPIHVHRSMSESVITQLITRISHIRLYAVITQLDDVLHVHSQGLPAIIHIHAIPSQSHSIKFLLELQHLPPASSSLFSLIQQLCHLVFSSDNIIFSCGNLQQSLALFESFNLFSLSQLIHVLDLQSLFATHWNSLHPHTAECLSHPTVVSDDCETDDTLVCLVNTDDLEIDSLHANLLDDYSGCTCPSDIRPYKGSQVTWSLHKALDSVFHQSLELPLISNLWSCGLDFVLTPCVSLDDQTIRQNLVSHLVQTADAYTSLYFFLGNSVPSLVPSNSPVSYSLSVASPSLPIFYLLADSHGRHLPSTITTSTYTLINTTVSGLHWFHPTRQNLSVQSLISSPEIFSHLSSCQRLLLLVGTNSARNTPASVIIEQISNIVDTIRSRHSQLSSTRAIAIAMVFPCYKTSTIFPSLTALTRNIQDYHALLHDLSISHRFLLVNLQIQDIHISRDRLHVHNRYSSLLSDNIIRSFTHSSLSTNQRRSIAARRRRYTKRRTQLKLQRHQSL
ncbi:unnamed protein product [Adineta ricciae]|uniref:Uncharacterized protein n=1 Tax=Adineta ricciae TaxID=249248 RepID=A0A816FH68_ADIRI|nr:unnamed protein product [Adineta ricciae]